LEAFLAGAFLAGFSDSESLPLLEDDSCFFEAFFTGAFLAGFSLSSLSESELDDSCFFDAFFTGAFLAGFSLSDELSSDDEDYFLACFLAGAFLATTLTDSSEEESSSDDELSCTFDFFCGTLALSLVFLALFFCELALLTFDAALGLLVTGLATDDCDELSSSLSEDDSCFFDFFFKADFFSASF
jgi:hypothetical protein